MAQHARLSASAAHRWLNCPGSVGLAETLPEPPSSEFAEEGTRAHADAADSLNLGMRSSDPAIQEYVSYCLALAKGREWKAELDLTPALVAGVHANLGGTADFVTWDKNELHVVDFKYGQGIYVSAEDNPQLKIYALGALLTLVDFGIKPKTVTMHVVQPRYEAEETTRTYTVSADSLTGDFLSELYDAALEEATVGGQAKFVQGAWCKWCPAAAICPVLRQNQGALAKAEAGALTPVGIAKALELIPGVLTRIKAIEAEAYRLAQQGVEIPGFKLVNKRPRRVWNDEEAVSKFAFSVGVDPYESKLLSPAQLEKKLGKEEKKELTKYTSSVSSGTTLVPDSDNRQAAKAAITVGDFEKIGD